MITPTPPYWYADWVWSLPLIILTVVIHVLGLGVFVDRAIPVVGAR